MFRMSSKMENIYCWKDNNSSKFFNYLMNISTHLIIDAIIIFAALTITLVLRAKGNAVRKEKESKWLLKKRSQNSKTPNYLEFGIFLFMEVL